ncbi:MAG TPA: glycosyltransferase [Chromatiaceae bacterium]|nr:glycosyltransferase [Chromatiaceae bacterium]HIB84098.1 glycosyltransferase [Chromatiaceae bacterium]HIN82725.1 glycosyltransferase [Chromatiales bacterium]HIO14853.1 glycosyltransferase [Chromatiales bacterium]
MYISLSALGKRDSTAMKLLFCYEYFFPPFDEGMKKTTHMIFDELEADHEMCLVRNLTFLPHQLNSLLITPRLILRGLWLRPERIIYVPESALTFSALIKSWLLGLFFGSRLAIFGLQKRSFKPWQRAIISRLPLRNVFVLSSAMAEDLEKLGIHATVLPIGIDRETYVPSDNKHALKSKYGLPQDKPVLLHVGHIKTSRNAHWLAEVQQALPTIQVVLIGSTATDKEERLCTQLEDSGVRVIREYLADIHELYQLSDWYCFPVTEDFGAMETPLSVLEAMATNLPIITTRFGVVPELFDEDEYFRFVSGPEDIIAIIRQGFESQCMNRRKTEPYTWNHTAQRLLER